MAMFTSFNSIQDSQPMKQAHLLNKIFHRKLESPVEPGWPPREVMSHGSTAVLILNGQYN